MIVVPDVLGVPQPLCAVYHREVCSFAEQALQDGDYKIGRLFARVPTRYIMEQEIVASGFSADIFRNLNTREEYDELTASRSSDARLSRH
jgi:molybdopterin-guanine dinucleotide biosynthesis protein A